jgi:hypothetical protein
LCHFVVIQTAKLVRIHMGNNWSSRRERVPSSPNCESSAGVKARHPTAHALVSNNNLALSGDGDGDGDGVFRICVTIFVPFCPILCHFLSPQPMPTTTGLFERNGHCYLRAIIQGHQRHTNDQTACVTFSRINRQTMLPTNIRQLSI